MMNSKSEKDLEIDLVIMTFKKDKEMLFSED